MSVAVSEPSNPLHAWLVRSRAVIGMVILVPFGAVAICQQPWAALDSFAGLAFELLGWALLLTGTAFRLWATLYIGGRKATEVVSTGPYSLCRNPLYFGTFLMTISIAAFLQNAVFAVGVCLAAAVYLSTTIKAEETLLSMHFGEAYTEYCRRVPRFLPRLGPVVSPATLEVDTRALRVEAIRSLRCGAIAVVGHLVPWVHEWLRHLWP